MEKPIENDCNYLNQKGIPNETHFLPGYNGCTLCTCDEGEPKWCKVELCSPPPGCNSFKMGNSCCDLICLDGRNIFNHQFIFSQTNFSPMLLAMLVMLAISAGMMLLSLLFLCRRVMSYLIRQHQIQGQYNSEDND